MTTWIIEPHDPLIVRDGRPFGPNPGARAVSLSFPFPSTTTGGVRARAGLNAIGIFDLTSDQVETLKGLKVRGPLLVQLTPDGKDIEPGKWLIPAPLDALLFASKQPGDTPILKQLVPLQPLKSAQTDLDKEALLLVGLPQFDPSKPLKGAPHYWYWETFQMWLVDPARLTGKRPLSSLGHSGPQREQRTHVSIDNDKYAAKDGALFETSGLEFTYTAKQYEHRLSTAQRLALAVIVDENNQFKLRDGLAGFAGERRLVSWRKSSVDRPSLPEKLEQAIMEQKACRIFLLTPACFEQGYRPTRLVQPRHGVISTLQAIAIQRPQVVSGWDLAFKKPKRSRRLAPAGTVLFLSLEGNTEAIRNWIRSIWMECISDNPQDRNDGFGLAVLGTWSGKPEMMQKEQQS